MLPATRASLARTGAEPPPEAGEPATRASLARTGAEPPPGAGEPATRARAARSWRESGTIADVARRQHGMVTTRQLSGAGLGGDAIRHRVRHGWLVPVHRGVYQVGPLRAPLGRETAALLACGPAAALSHDSAAALWGFRPPCEGDVHVTTAHGGARSRPGIRVHRTRALDAAVRDGLRITTPTRTLQDLATALARHDLDRAVEQALVLRLATHEQLATATGRGAAALRTALKTDPAFTRSEGERRLRALLRAAGLPLPQTNVRVAGWEVDAVWPEQRLVVEVDGFAFHGSRHAFERDRRRDAELVAAGYRVVRVTWRQLTEEPLAVVARLARLLEVAVP